MLQRFLADEGATEQLGAELAMQTPPGGVWLLKGDLGAGKTTWARGFVAGLGGNPEDVSSPTYAVLHCYETPAGRVFHLDLYRLGSSCIHTLGLEESVGRGDRLLVEWPGEDGPMPTEWISTLELVTQDGGRIASWGCLQVPGVRG